MAEEKKVDVKAVGEKSKGFFAEFKKFIMRGNVMDLAVGVIIGAAFQNIVTALTASFINPLIALITGGVEKDEAGNLMLVGGQFEVKGVVFDYGSFISAILNFLIMALILFIIIKSVNTAMAVGKKKEEPKAPTEKDCPYCKSKIAIKAVKCPFCTSDVPEEPVEE